MIILVRSTIIEFSWWWIRLCRAPAMTDRSWIRQYTAAGRKLRALVLQFIFYPGCNYFLPIGKILPLLRTKIISTRWFKKLAGANGLIASSESFDLPQQVFLYICVPREFLNAWRQNHTDGKQSLRVGQKSECTTNCKSAAWSSCRRECKKPSKQTKVNCLIDAVKIKSLPNSRGHRS